MTRRVLADQLETCWSLGIRYDMLNYESQIVRSGLWENAFGRMKEMGMATLAREGENAGCWVIRDKVIVRSNGTATYMAKDIPYAAWKMGLVEDPFTYREYGAQPDGTMLYESVLEGGRRMEREAADRVITVIDSRQADLQRTVSDIMGGKVRWRRVRTHGIRGGDAQRRHCPHAGRPDTNRLADVRAPGHIRGSRPDVRQAAGQGPAEETYKRNPDMSEDMVDAISRAVAVGAIRYEMIRQDLGRAITFDMERSTRLEGGHRAVPAVLARARPPHTGEGPPPSPTTPATCPCWCRTRSAPC